MSGNKLYRNTSCQADARRTERLYAAVEQFEYSPELAKRVYYLGQPHFTDSIPTASLAVSKKGKPVFGFNRQFFDSLGNDELMFVIFHETLHYVFRHHSRCRDRIPALWNIASDLVVNAFLLREVGFAQVSSHSFKKFLDYAITFTNLSVAAKGVDLAKLTVEEVYDLLAENLQSDRTKFSNIKACDEHVWLEYNAGDDPEQGSLFDELAEQAQQVFRDWLPHWGDTPLGELRVIGEIDKSSGIDWDHILSRRIASSIQLTLNERWAPPNRKIAWLYPDLLLPAEHQVEKNQISVLMAIDASGSISPLLLDRLLGVARSIPADLVQLTTISFDTMIYPVDIWENAPAICGGGGTSFGTVEAFAKQLTQYPDLVVVLTDGFAPRPAVQYPQRWFWLITEHGDSKQIEGIGCYCRITCPKSLYVDRNAISAHRTCLITNCQRTLS